MIVAGHTHIKGDSVNITALSNTIYYIIILENVEHCGGEPEQADTACLLANRNAWVPGEGLYILCVVCPLVLGCQGKACLSTCGQSHGKPLGEGMSVECGYICVDFYTKILS